MLSTTTCKNVPEVVWSKINGNAISYRVNGQKRNLGSRIIRVPLNSSRFSIVSDNHDFLSLLDGMLETSLPEDSKTSLMPTLYHLSKGNPSGIDGQTRCFYNPDNNHALVYASSFGLFKSLVLGMSSSLLEADNYHPVHACIMDIDDKGVMINGAHGLGKTTSMLHLMALLGPKARILTDDWGLVRLEGETLTARTLENKISFRQDVCEKYPYLPFPLSTMYQERQPTSINKVYVSREKLSGNTGLDSSKITHVVLLGKDPNGPLFKDVESVDASSEIVDSSYHMPTCTPLGRKSHEVFWKENLKRTKIIVFNSRHPGNMMDNYRKLLGRIRDE